jgi:SnoaL-like domain
VDIEHLAERVRALEDREAIRELIARYSFEVDCGDPPDWAAVFSPEIEMEAGKLGVSHGLAAIEQRFGRAEHLDAIREGSQHAYSNIVVELGPGQDEARAWGYACVHVRRGEGWAHHTLGVNHWRLRRGGGGWRIIERSRREVGESAWKQIVSDVPRAGARPAPAPGVSGRKVPR